MRGCFLTAALLRQLQPVGVPSRAARTEASVEAAGPIRDPRLAPRDEAVLLLTAAEIEHALMVQYLYAAYLVRAPRETTPTELDRIQDLLFQIAREEMGHLATVQNLLHLIGGPLNFNRGRIGFLRKWISVGAPDNVPAGEVGVHHEREPAQEPVAEAPPVPTTTAPLGFAADIRPLFRDSPDRGSMLAIAGLDLHRFEDVRDNADPILARLVDGTMPCDGSWPPDRVATFRKWIDDGKHA
jgi:Ferritin-like